ncbi:DMT family transporter [Gymnodinialimonas ulvae]|uniref:DMT family transporter n=1 Tax=Gymnodinialimonas ulvae TaxID=3126504 RepID=UPI0030980AD2
MSSQYLFALIAIAVGGACISTQAPINARLGSHVGDPVAAAAISFIVGAIALSLIVMLRGAVPSAGQMASAPWWAWVGGALGAVYVWAAVWSVGTLGVLTMVAALIFGQLAAALLLDAIGAFGLQVREISWTRIAAIALVAAGLVLSRL